MNTEKRKLQETIDTLMNLPVLFGLAPGHIQTIKRMLEEGATWDQIGEELGWCPETAKEHYRWYVEQQEEIK
jgi:DNA-binding NarL/FixJ family response regulator